MARDAGVYSRIRSGKAVLARAMKRHFCFTALLGLSAASQSAALCAQPAADGRRLLAERCEVCHGERARVSGLRLDQRGPAMRGGDSGLPGIVPGDPEASRVYLRAAAHEMPPGGPPLDAGEIESIRAWIASGAAWDSDTQSGPEKGHWAFRILADAPPPSTGSPSNPIDRYVAARLQEQGLRPNPTAEPAALVRRLYLDLTGLPPTAEAVESFARNATDEAYGSLVDHLLESPHFGERSARFWLDVARYADSAGYEEDRPRPNAYRYRDFVIEAFNRDLPYDRFVAWQLAGDILRPGDPEALAATGFLAAGPDVRPDFVNFREKDRLDELDDIIATTGQAFLGLTLGCARCHDHKSDPVTTREYYQLSAFFGSTERHAHPWDAEEGGRHERELADFNERHRPVREALETWVESRHEAIRRERIEALDLSEEQKRLLAAPVDEVDAEQAALRTRFAGTLTVTDEQLRDRLDAAAIARWDALAEAERQVAATKPRDIPRALGIREGEPKPTWVLGRGNPEDRGERVSRGLLRALSCPDWAKRPLATRADLAEWITDTECGAGALAARVLASRLWQRHFGRGLTETPGDFGVRGAAPALPGLVEHLAGELVRNGWRLKPVHRLIVTSRTYRQSSRRNESSAVADPGNLLWWRRDPMRLEAEALRDTILSVSGSLNRKLHGPAVKPSMAPEAIYRATENYDRWPEDVQDGPSTWRRSIYIFTKRANLFPFLQTFGTPSAIGSCTRRDASSGPLQALSLMNDKFMLEQSRLFAERVLVESGRQPAERVTTAYRLALGRPPRSAERERAVAFLHGQAQQYELDLGAEAASPSQFSMRALTDFCHALLASSELMYVN